MVWNVVVESLFLIRPALAKLSLYCHIWALLGRGAFSGNLIQALIVFKRLADLAFLFGSDVSLNPRLPLFSVSLASLHPFHHAVLCTSALSQALTQMRGCRDERGSHIAYNASLHWGL